MAHKWLPLREEAHFLGSDRGLATVFNIQLLVDADRVLLHSAGRDMQSGGNLFIGETLSKKQQRVHLTMGECFVDGRRCRSAGQGPMRSPVQASHALTLLQGIEHGRRVVGRHAFGQQRLQQRPDARPRIGDEAQRAPGAAMRSARRSASSASGVRP